MELVTFQSMEALKYLVNNGYLVCDSKYINHAKSAKIYSWVIDKMKNYPKDKNINVNVEYPIWCWVKCYNGIYPPTNKKAKKVSGFDVKITFEKKIEDIFITDFRRYSFLLNNVYIPNSKEDKLYFDNLLIENKITQEELKAYMRSDKYPTCRNDEKFLQVCKIIQSTFDRCITTDSNVLQGCVWDIKLQDIKKIEILNDDYCHGSLNYIRSNGKRINWQENYYKKLK